MNEPQPPAPQSRPCSTPHSAPVAWLRAEPPVLGEDEGPPPTAHVPEDIVAKVLTDPTLLAEVLKRAAIPTPASSPEGSGGSVRHDGWTGERMARFLEVLADTGIVAEACRVVGMSREGAYALRNRDPVFDAAWTAAQSKARPLVADGLLERSITGTVEHYYRDGVLVGERRHYESWLGLAVLKRLDKQAAEDRADANLSAKIVGDWGAALNAFRDGGSAAVRPALEPELDEVDTPPTPPGCDPWDNVWRTDEGAWMTTFPPPPGFDGYESRPFDGFNYYKRACTAEEIELLEVHEATAEAEEKRETTEFAEAERDIFFAGLRDYVASAGHPDLDPGPVFSSAPPEAKRVPDQGRHDDGLDCRPGLAPR